MRLPFLQVQQDAWAKARMLAPLLGISRREAFGLLSDLWAWGLELGPDDQPPTGILESPRASRMLAGAMEWTGKPDELVEALVDVSAVALIPNGLRVRGMNRYRKAWEKAQKERDRKAKWKASLDAEETDPGRGTDAEKTRKERGSDAEREGKKETYTQTHTQKLLPTEVEEAPPPQLKDIRPAAEFTLGQTVEPPTNPVEAWTGDDFWRFAQCLRQEGGLIAEPWPENRRKLGEWWSRCLMTPGVTSEAMRDGFYKFGQTKHWEKSTPPFPFRAFAKQWSDYVTPEVKHGTAA